MKSNTSIILAFISAFALGIGMWMVKSDFSSDSMINKVQETSQQKKVDIADSVIVNIGNEPVKASEVEFEYRIYLSSIDETQEQMIPLSPTKSDELENPSYASLKEKIISEIVERKTLAFYIKNLSGVSLDSLNWQEECGNKADDARAMLGSLVASGSDFEILKSRICEQVLIEEFFDKFIERQFRFTDNQLLNYYTHHEQEFNRPEQVIIRQILLEDEKDAKIVRNRVKRYNFSSLAKANSIAPEAENGGLLGPFAKGQLPAIFDIAFTMKEHQISDVLKSSYGFHIIYLEDKLDAKKLSFEEAKPRIVEVLKSERKQEEFKKWVDLAMEKVNIDLPKLY